MNPIKSYPVKKALVISGGGSKGAFAGGIAEYLIKDLKINYDIFLGTSTGSLLVPLLALGEIERLKTAYTTVNQKDIFSNCPFKIKYGNDGSIRSSIHHLRVAWNFIRGRKTFGESKTLRTTIRQFFSKDDFSKLIKSKEKVVVTVSNLTRNVVEYKYAKDYSYEDFCDWIWISCNFVPFMSLTTKNGYEYADGGFGNLIPTREAIDAGAKEIDVIVLHPRHYLKNKPQSTNAFGVLTKTMDFMLDQIAKDDTYIALSESIHSGIKTRFFHTPELLTENSFVFIPEKMSQWWEMGYRYAQNRIHTG